jgi:predicted nucleic acid-binding Zn ribbon protein
VSPWKPLRRSRAEVDPKRISDSLDAVAKRAGMASAGAVTPVFGRWAEIVGPAVADHSKPHSLREGVLKVHVDDPAWATQLRYLTPTIVARCNELAGPGSVTSVQVQVAR